MKIKVLGLGESIANYTPDNCTTIGVNDIYKLHKTDYLVCIDSPRRFSENRKETIIQSTPKKFFTHIEEWHPLVMNYQKIKLQSPRGYFFGIDRKEICYGLSSPIVACVIAYKMGAKEIELFGVDFNSHPNFSDDKLENAIKDYVKLSNVLKQRGVKLIPQPQSRLFQFL